MRDRHETALEYARVYGSILAAPRRRTWIQPPGQLEKIGEFYGADRAYKQAARAAKDYVEVRDLLLKRREQAFHMEDNCVPISMRARPRCCISSSRRAL